LECEKPFRFDISIAVTELPIADVFNMDDLDVLCSGNKIEMKFTESDIPTREFDRLLGRRYTLTVTSVWDKAGNVLEEYTYTSNFVCVPPSPRLVISHPSGEGRYYLPNEAMVFRAVISIEHPRENWARTTLELGVDFVPTEPLAEPHEYTMNGSDPVTTEIAVMKGPGKSMRFDPVILFLRSSCSQDSEDPITVTDTLWNKRSSTGLESIIWTAPCPAIRWAGRREQHNQFQYSLNLLTSLSSLLEVSVFNEVCLCVLLCIIVEVLILTSYKLT
jgi:hypothetical protein